MHPARPPAALAGRSFPAAVWWGVLYLGVISTALAFYLWNKGFTLLDAATGSLFFFVQPVVGAVLGWLLLGEILGGRYALRFMRGLDFRRNRRLL